MDTRKKQRPVYHMNLEGLTGKIEAGDTVQTLTLKRAREGVVESIKKGRAHFQGEEYPGGPKYPTVAHVENLKLIRKGDRAK